MMSYLQEINKLSHMYIINGSSQSWKCKIESKCSTTVLHHQSIDDDDIKPTKGGKTQKESPQQNHVLRWGTVNY